MTLPSDNDSSFEAPHQKTEYAPISLNHLIQEGIQIYFARDHGEGTVWQFDLELAQDLFRIFGEPTQLRSLFSLLVDSLAESLDYSVPLIKFTTKNLIVAPGAIHQVDPQTYLAPGHYALLQVLANGHTHIPNFEPHSAIAQTSNANLFAWSQIFEVIQLHRGKVINYMPTDVATSFEIVLPALQSFHHPPAQLIDS